MIWPYFPAAICVLIVGRCAFHGRRPVRTLLAGAACGLGALAILALLQPLTGVELPLNRFTAFVAAVLGVPGVTALLVLQWLL